MSTWTFVKKLLFLIAAIVETVVAYKVVMIVKMVNGDFVIATLLAFSLVVGALLEKFFDTE